ncbi:MAG TPA: hypothetical protein VKE88_02070 [Candidatus Nanoarchaeia archaeon]|nr:hypothetical protein [Candidatus Nanoarchaeia archaeon]
MVRFHCENCGYSFEPKTGKMEPPRICPYCNRRDAVVRQKSAQELLNDFSGD